jgi:hypothetical protein
MTTKRTPVDMTSTPNYAFERSVTAWQGCAAGAQAIVAPEARRPRLARPAQRGR